MSQPLGPDDKMKSVTVGQRSQVALLASQREPTVFLTDF